MRKLNMLVLLAPFVVSLPALSQSIESSAVHAAAAGLGAGLAASQQHGKIVRRSYESMLLAEQAAIAQSKAIEQYMKLGCQCEAKKQFDSAEKSFKYVLQVVALRDGPGSSKGVPALRHLVAVSQAQGKLDDAVEFQKTVLAFARAAKIPNQTDIASAQLKLCNLFIKKEDYASAEVGLREVSTAASVPRSYRRVTLTSYARVLRKVHKDAEADKIDREIEKLDGVEASSIEAASSSVTQSDLNLSPPAVTGDNNLSDLTQTGAQNIPIAPTSAQTGSLR